MKASKLFLLGTLVLAIFMAMPAMAQPVTFNGDVENDFPDEPGVLIIKDSGNPGGVAGEIMAGANVSGWDIKDIRLAYDPPPNDIMYVGVNSFGTVGDIDGNGCPDTSDDPVNFPEFPNLCDGEVVAVYFDLDMLPAEFDNIQSWDVIIGVSAGFCNEGFMVAECYKLSGASPPPGNFGPPLELHFNPDDDPICPSLSWPDYEFTILNFSELLPNPEQTDLNLIEFRVGASMGSPSNGDNIQDFVYHHHIPDSTPDLTLEKISGDGQAGEPGSTLPEPFVVQVLDQNTDPFEGVPVIFSVITGGGSLDVETTTTDPDGHAESTLTLGPSPGINTVEVTAADIPTPVTFEAIAEIELNQPPVADPGGPYVAPKSCCIKLDGTGSQDPDPGDTITFAWDLDCDGEFDDSTDSQPEFCVGSEIGRVYDIGLEVTDSFGVCDIDYTTVEVIPYEPVAIDIKPMTCPNPINYNFRGKLPVVICGTEDFDVSQVDPDSIFLEGVEPLRWSHEDVCTPFYPLVGKASQLDCTEEGPDGFMDMTLKFDGQLIVEALELLSGPLTDGEEIPMFLTGNLLPEYGGIPIVGEEVVTILVKGK